MYSVYLKCSVGRWFFWTWSNSQAVAGTFMELRGSSSTHSELFESKSTPLSNIFDNELWTGNTTQYEKGCWYKQCQCVKSSHHHFLWSSRPMTNEGEFGWWIKFVSHQPIVTQYFSSHIACDVVFSCQLVS